MPAIWARTRAELRRRVKATLMLMLFVGVAGGAILGALAGARRTDTAYERMRRSTEAGDVLVSVERTGLLGFYHEVSGLPGVAAVGAAGGLDLRVASTTTQRIKGLEPLLAFAPVDAALLSRVGRPVIAAGRLPRADHPDEAFANRFMADLGVRPGTRIEVQILAGDDRQPFGEPKPLTIVGTGVFPNEVVPIAVNDTFPTLSLSPAFFETHLAGRIGSELDILAFDGAFVRLEAGVGVDAFRQEVERLVAKHEQTTGGLFFLSEVDRIPIIRRAVRPQVVALQLFALSTGLAALVLVGQAVARQLYGDASDYTTLSALGMTRRQLLGVGIIRTTLVGVGGAVIAVVVAGATSPFMPIGPSRTAEPDPGLNFDAAILGVGSVGIVVALLLAVAIPAYRHARGRLRDATPADRPSTLSRLLARTGAPTSMATGVRMAVDPGRGATSTPIRSATIGTTLGIAALAATLAFGSSLDRLIETPRLYGETWDLTGDASFGAIPATPALDRLEASPDVEAFSAGVYGEVEIEGLPVTAIGVEPIRGNLYPTMLEGRPPRNSDEIVLGTRTLQRIGRRVGDTVPVSVDEEPRNARVVGRAVFPRFGLGSFAPTGLGEGALTTVDALPPPSFGEETSGYSFFLLDIRDGVAPGVEDRVRDLIIEGIPGCDEECFYVEASRRPGDVDNFARVRSTPYILAGLLALLAIAAVGHALITSVRRRARDLAILKTLGFVRRQVSATVAWQASTMIAISLVVGIPAGIGFGRAIWRAFANGLGVPAEPIVPLMTTAAGVLAALLVANAAAAWPGARAARLSPAVVLRDE